MRDELSLREGKVLRIQEKALEEAGHHNRLERHTALSEGDLSWERCSELGRHWLDHKDSGLVERSRSGSLLVWEERHLFK